TAIEDSERISTELILAIEKHRSEVTQLIKDQERVVMNRIERRLQQLELELEE
ncbi:hypothetical protein M9458_007425, partial [Cirrhinus mrigala]